MLYQQITNNKRKTVLVVFIFTLILAATGAGIGFIFNNWLGGIIVALIMTGIYLLIVLQNPANMVMALNRAHQVSEQDHPELFHVVQDMAMVARIPMPKIYIINDKSPNAFATGRDPKHASIAVTQGLLDMMNREELEGVIGHEVSHIRNYDILLSTISIVMVGVITFLSGLATRILFWWGDDNDDDNNNSVMQIIKIVLYLFTIILAPLAASLAQFALSRNREYLADASSVYLTRDPQGLISALEKIQNSQPMKNVDPSSTALYIEDPLHKKGGWSHLFDTHPSTKDRIDRLEHM